MHLVEDEHRARVVDVERGCTDRTQIPSRFEPYVGRPVAPTCERKSCSGTTAASELVPTEGDVDLVRERP